MACRNVSALVETAPRHSRKVFLSDCFAGSSLAGAGKKLLDRLQSPGRLPTPSPWGEGDERRGGCTFGGRIAASAAVCSGSASCRFVSLAVSTYIFNTCK